MKRILTSVILLSVVFVSTWNVQAATPAGHRDQRNPAELFKEFQDNDTHKGFCAPSACGSVSHCCPNGGKGICSIIVSHMDCATSKEDLAISKRSKSKGKYRSRRKGRRSHSTS